TFRERAIKWMLDRPGMTDLKRADIPLRMNDRFDMFHLLKASSVSASILVSPDEFAVPASLIVPGLYHIAQFFQEVEKGADVNNPTVPTADPIMELVEMSLSIPVSRQAGAEGSPARYEITAFDLDKQFEPGCSPNNLIHAFFEMCTKREIGEPMLQLFTPEIRGKVQDSLTRWNAINTQCLTEQIIPGMESMREVLVKHGQPTTEIDKRLESARLVAANLPNWPFWLVDDYMVQFSMPVVDKEAGETKVTAVRVSVFSQVKLRSFMPHRLDKQMMFQDQPALRPMNFGCIRVADGSWRIATNPFDIKDAMDAALGRAKGR
ncbi:MAG: hypothetical protein AB7K09_12610, partial [Planctomycetota bacterium]